MAQEITININNTLSNPPSATTGTQLKDSFSPGALKFN